MRRTVLGVVASTFGLVAAAQAQTDFAATGLRPGDTVRVTRPSGVRIMGTITTVSSTVLTVDGFTFAPEPGLTVERSGDSLWNGLAIGVAIGTALGVATRVRGCFQGVTVECVVKPGLAFGALGALIDHRRVGRTTVFVGTGPSSARLIPLLSSDAKGLLVRFHF